MCFGGLCQAHHHFTGLNMCWYVLVYFYIRVKRVIEWLKVGEKFQQDEVAEWLRRWTANPLGSARVGSNPILVEHFR